MFESTVSIGMERGVARRLISLPLALTFQALLALTFVLYSLFVQETLPPPMLMLSGAPSIAIPVAFVPRRETPAHRTDQAATAPRDNSLKAPGMVPDQIRPGADAPPAETGPAGEEPPPGWITTDLPGILSGPPADAQPARRVVQGWELVKVPQLLRRVEPVYPPAAAAIRLAGRVVLNVVVDERGRVESVEVASSTNSIFNQAAIEAVRRWEYTPPVGQGSQSVACSMAVVVTFALR